MTYSGRQILEAGGIDIHRFRNPQRHIKLRRNPLIPMKFQFLFGSICLCLFLSVLTSTWHKSGTRTRTELKPLDFAFKWIYLFFKLLKLLLHAFRQISNNMTILLPHELNCPECGTPHIFEIYRLINPELKETLLIKMFSLKLLNHFRKILPVLLKRFWGRIMMQVLTRQQVDLTKITERALEIRDRLDEEDS